MPPLRLIRAAPAAPVRPRVEAAPPARLSYADSLKRQNAIDRRIDSLTTPYSDYRRGLAAQRKAPIAAPGETFACRESRKPAACRPLHAPTLGLKLADVPPPQAVRREIVVRTTYRVEVPLTSGRLIDVVM